MEWSGRELLNNAKRGCARAEMDRWMDGRMRLVVDVIYHLHNNLNKRPLAGTRLAPPRLSSLPDDSTGHTDIY